MASSLIKTRFDVDTESAVGEVVLLCDNEQTMSSSIFGSFPDIPASGQVTVCERYGELIFVNQEELKYEVKGYPTVYITQDSTRSLAQGENAKSAFLPHNETVSKRVYHAWLDMGLSGALEEIVNSMADTPNWLALTAQKLLLLTRWTKSLHGSFFPHLALSNEDIVANFTRLADWGSGPVRAFAWHPHTIKFSYALQDDTVRIHSHATELVPILKHKLQKNVADLAWQPNSSSVLAVACQSCILIWHVEPTSLATRPSSSAAQVLQQNNHCPVTSVTWSPDGRLLASASPIDTAMLVWDVATETCTPIRRFGGGGVSLLSWSPDGGKLFTATPSNLFRVWETRSWCGEKWTSKTGRVKAACWGPHGNTVLFSTENEPIIYSLTFFDDVDEKKPVIGGSQIAVACADLSEVELQVDEDSTVKVGGVIQSMVWDETGERLAVMFKDNKNYVALFRTKVSPLLEITPCGFVKGKNEETPHCIQFQPRCETGALLTVIWSSGRVGYIPLQFVASDETVEYHKFHQPAVNLSQHLQSELYTEQL